MQPEWFFAHILNAITDHAQFLRNDVQTLLNEAHITTSSGRRIDALADFISALLKPLEAKIRRSILQLLDMNVPNLIAHTIYQAMSFDAALRAIIDYQPRYIDDVATPHKLTRSTMHKWRGTADIILGNRTWYDGWKDAEKKCKLRDVRISYPC